MGKLIGFKKIKIAVFISGRGSNLLNLIKYFKNKNSRAQINLIVSSNQKAKGLNYGKFYNIKKKYFNFNNQKITEDKILIYLSQNQISLICLAGFMKILSKQFIKKFKGQIINIHPSLLPKFKGLNTHERAINNNEKYSGCTVHFVSHKLDSGKIILKKRIKINKNENSKTLAKKVLSEEHKLYPKAIEKVLINL